MRNVSKRVVTDEFSLQAAANEFRDEMNREFIANGQNDVLFVLSAEINRNKIQEEANE